MGDRRHVPDGTHLQSSCLQRTNGRLAPRTWSPHQNITVLHAVLIPDGDGSCVRRLGGGKGGAFSASPKSPSPGGRTGQDIPFPIADGDLRVIESGLDINTPMEHGLLFFLFGSLCLTFSLRHRSSRYRLARGLHSKGLTFPAPNSNFLRTLSSTSVGMGSLSPDRQTSPVTQAAVTVDIH